MKRLGEPRQFVLIFAAKEYDKPYMEYTLQAHDTKQHAILGKSQMTDILWMKRFELWLVEIYAVVEL